MEFGKLFHRIAHGRHHHTREQIDELTDEYPKLARIEDMKDALQKYLDDMHRKPATQRNFRIECCEHDDDVHIAMQGIRSRLYHDFHTDLQESYRFENGNRWGCANGIQTVTIRLDQKESVAFCPTLLHEVGHHFEECPRHDPDFDQAFQDFLMKPSKGKGDEVSFTQQIRSIVSRFQSKDRIGEAEKQALLGYASSDEAQLEEAMHLDELSRSLRERHAWAYAFRKTRKLEREGFDFGFPHEEMQEHSHACMARYELGNMQNTILDQGSEDLSAYNTYYLTRKKLQGLLSAVGHDDRVIFG